MDSQTQVSPVLIMQVPFGRAVWSTIMTQLDQIYDFSSIMGYISLELLNRGMIFVYWMVQKSLWQYALWLSFGALRYVDSVFR